MSPRFPCRAIAASIALLALTAGLPAAGAEPHTNVIVAPRPQPLPRADVAAVCPDIADALNHALTPAARMWGKEGTVRVEFRLRDGEITEVSSRGGPQEYRLPIRRAVRELACRAAPGGDHFAFAIRFDLRESAAGDTPRRVAELRAP